MARASFLNFFPRSAEGVAESAPEAAPDALSLFRNFEESCRGWFWSTDESGRLSYVSPSAKPLLNDHADTLQGMALTDLFRPASEETEARNRLPFLLGKRSRFDRIVLRSAHADTPYWWEVSGTPQFDAAQNFTGYFGFAVDVTEQLQSSESASQLALYDTLTGLPNRLNMKQYLAASLEVLHRPGASCAVMLLDLDRFKQVNDSLGHPAGDALLKLVAERLTKIIGDREKIFRLGGDEFQVILPDCDDRDALGEIANRIIASVSQPYMIEGSRCIIGVSIGVAVAPDDGRTSEEVMRNADLALYAAKGNGRGCFQYFSDSLLEVAEDRRALEDDLRDALVRGELSLFYQPVVSVKTSCVTGVEALIRWHHPVRGPVSPALFIPIAEEANLIHVLGEWVLRKACSDAASWPGDIRVAVNVSPIQFANEALPGLVMSALASSGLPPSRLELELTEGVFLSESTETDTMFSNLKDIGVRLALDDFGTGYSSLGYLKTAPFDKIKIDQSFVRGATLPGSRNGAIIAAIVALARALDMETTAEGIETIDQLDLIRDLGVSHIQGYVYSKPLPEAELHKGLEDGEWSITPTGPAKQRKDRRSLYRRAGAIIGNQYLPILIRNLSESGAYVEGLAGAPEGTMIIVDFGECQMETAVVRRVQPKGHGIEFAQPLVSDGAGSLCPNTRVSPYALSRMGLSSSDHLGASRVWDPSNTASIESVTKSLGLTMPSATMGQGGLGDGGGHKVHHFFGSANPLHNLMLLGSGHGNGHHLSNEDWEKLKKAVEASHNPQLKYIIAFVVLTGIRLHELLAARWEDIDLERRIWTIRPTPSARARQIPLSTATLDLIEQLPKYAECDHLIVNPRTKKPYHSFYGSWDAARRKAGLDNLSIHDLRNSIRRTW